MEKKCNEYSKKKIVSNKILRINIIFYMMFCDKPFHSVSHSHSISMFGILHEFPSLFFFILSPRSTLTNENVFQLLAAVVAGPLLIFLFLFSVILLFFMLATAINKWNVHPKRILLFLHSFYIRARIFQFTRSHSRSLNIHRCPVSEYNMNIRSVWNVCHLFIYLHSLLIHSYRCIENIPFLALINKFIIKYLSLRILFRSFRILYIFFFLSCHRHVITSRNVSVIYPTLWWNFSNAVVIYN